MKKKLLPTYRLDRKVWLSDFFESDDGSILLRAGTKTWWLPRFNLFSWDSLKNWIVFWMAKRQGKIEKINH